MEKSEIEKDPDWTIESRNRFNPGTVKLLSKDKMTKEAFHNMLANLSSEIEIIDSSST